jgi:hypothetical protein
MQSAPCVYRHGASRTTQSADTVPQPQGLLSARGVGQKDGRPKWPSKFRLAGAEARSLLAEMWLRATEARLDRRRCPFSVAGASDGQGAAL